MRCKLLIIVVLLAVSCHKKHAYDNVKLIGHAASGLNTTTSPYHDNSKEAVQYALNMEGIAGIEIDIQCSASQTAWLFHDEQLTHETNGSGCVSTATDDYLQTLHYTGLGKEALVKLADIGFPYGQREIFLDVRNANMCTLELLDEQEVIHCIEQALPAGNTATIRVVTNKTEWVHDLYLKGWKVYLNLSETPAYLNGSTLNETTGLCIRNAEISRDEVASVRAAGKEVVIFEVRSPKGIRSALKKQPDYLMTDDLKAALIEKYP